VSQPHAPKLLIARRVPESVAQRARQEFDAYITEVDMDSNSVVNFAREYQVPAVLIGKKSGLQAEHIARLPDSVRIIANASAGIDHMDVAAAQAKGIIVTNAPDALTECTADYAFMLLLAACRRAAEYEKIVRAGWGKSFGMTDMLGKRVNGKTLGIVGFGRIGRAVARRAKGFGLSVLYTDRQQYPREIEDGAQYVSNLHNLLPRCDILTLHTPAGNAPLMTSEEFNLLPQGAVFINAARGSLVDEDALLAALESGQLFAAGLDVYRNEPHINPRFASLPNVFLSPHMASATVETRDQMGFTALDNVAAVLAGRIPPNTL